MKKKEIFNQGLVEISFKTSGFILGIKWNGKLNSAYVKKINIPYKPALKTALERLSEPLVKKLTVRGIIGKTHGVSKAMKPPTIPNKNIPHKDFSVFFSPQSLAGFSKSMEEILY